MNDDEKVYDEIVEKSPTKHQYIYTEESLRRLKRVLPKKGKILDIGCGTGHIAQKIYPKKWYGVDISKKSLEVAENFYKQVKHGDITKRIPYASNTFDYVFSIGTLHHVPGGVKKVIKETARVLKKGGRIIIIDHDKRNLHIRMLHDSFLRLVPCKYERVLDPFEVINTLEENGFEVESLRPFHLEADQQALKFPIYKRIFKTPFLLLIKSLSNNSSEFFITAKNVNNK